MRTSLITLALCLASLPASAQRLPTTATPTRYALWFAPDHDQETFSGREAIDVTLATPSTTITLHATLGAFCSADRAAEIKAFFAAHPVPEAARALQQALERIATCSAVKARQSPAFSKWLAAR